MGSELDVNDKQAIWPKARNGGPLSRANLRAITLHQHLMPRQGLAPGEQTVLAGLDAVVRILFNQPRSGG